MEELTHHNPDRNAVSAGLVLRAESMGTIGCWRGVTVGGTAGRDPMPVLWPPRARRVLPLRCCPLGTFSSCERGAREHLWELGLGRAPEGNPWGSAPALLGGTSRSPSRAWERLSPVPSWSCPLPLVSLCPLALFLQQCHEFFILDELQSLLMTLHEKTEGPKVEQREMIKGPY